MTDLDPSSLDTLVAGVQLLSLDAGNTIIFLDHARIASTIAPLGFAVTRDALVRCEGEAKCLLEDGGGERPVWAYDGEPGGARVGEHDRDDPRPRGDRSGAPPGAPREALGESRRPEPLVARPRRARTGARRRPRRGVKVVVVSNSEGMLDVLFAKLAIDAHLDLLVDSGKVGIEKPDPGIWQIALEAYPTPADRVLHLGDTYATDIAGAEALGFRAALIDPYAHYAGRHERVARVPGVVEVARAIVRTASRAGPRA